jgi:hypothetical protein
MEALSRAELGTHELPRFVYPPLLIVVFVPLALLPYTAARIVWLVMNEIFLVAVVASCARIYEARTGLRPSLVFSVLFALGAAAAFAPTLNHNWQGQSNLLVLMLVSWALYFHLRSRPSDLATAGLLAPAVLLKIFPGIFLVYLLVRARFRAALWTGFFALVISAATLVVVPLSDYIAFPSVLLDSMYVREGSRIDGDYSMSRLGQDLAALIGLSPGPAGFVTALLRFLPVVALIGLAAREHSREPPSEAPLSGATGLVPAFRLSQAFVLMGLITTKWWEHHLTLLLFPLYLALWFVLSAPYRLRLATTLIVASALVVAIVRHPLLWARIDGTVWQGLTSALSVTKSLAIIALGAGLEVIIWTLKRGESRPLTEAARE